MLMILNVVNVDNREIIVRLLAKKGWHFVARIQANQMDQIPKLTFFLYFLQLCSADQRYKTILTDLKDCRAPDLPYAEYSPFAVRFELYNSTKGTNLLRGNLTIKENIDQSDKKARFKCGIETSEGLKWRFVTKNLGCKNLIVKSVFGAFGIPLVSGCSIKKGYYYLSDIDVAAADKAFQIPARTFGNWICVFAIYDSKFTLGCWDAYVKVVSKKAPKH